MIINIDKPIDWSSFDVVKKIRNITKHKKVGHGGTLDPFASGVLIIGTETDTKTLTSISNSDKTYEPEIKSDILVSVLNSFLGSQKQQPPMYSAKKHKGTRLYKLARKNIEVDRKDVDININSIDLIDFSSNSIKFRVDCSKGTYVRVLGKDIAEKLGTVGYLTSLKRTKVGNYLVNDSISVESFQEKWISTEL